MAVNNSLERMWTVDAADYVLLCLEPDGVCLPEQCLIFNVVKSGITIIDDNERARAVVQRMIAAGVPIVTECPPMVPRLDEEMEIFRANISDEEKRVRIKEMMARRRAEGN